MTFRALNWTPGELIGETKMDAMTDNAEDLFVTTPRAIYTLNSLRRVEGIKIASGRVIITKRNNDNATVEVRFNNYFSPNSQPNITTGIVSNGQTKIFAAVTGIGTLIPDNRGFRVSVEIAAGNEANDKIANSFYVCWNAMGI